MDNNKNYYLGNIAFPESIDPFFNVVVPEYSIYAVYNSEHRVICLFNKEMPMENQKILGNFICDVLNK